MTEQTIVWKKYVELEPIRRLRYEGRELLGKGVYLTEKRDGENVSIWLDESGNIHVASHNLEVASDDIINRFKATKEYPKAIEMLKDEQGFQNRYVIYGELVGTVGPTKIEPKHKRSQWVIFGIYDCLEHRYLGYNAIYQKAYHYKIPIVKAVAYISLNTMEELQRCIADYLKWCKRHRREGIVGKCYETQTFFKEKIDLPKHIKVIKSENKLQLPTMPEDRIIRALQHAYDEVGADNWKNVKVAMPVVAKHLSVEAEEHHFSPPRNFYGIYVNTPVETIKPKNTEEKQ